MSVETKKAPNHTPNNRNRGNKRDTGTGKGQRPTGKWGNVFKGETTELNGQVFQLQSERAKKGQFDNTLDALRRYSGKVYPKDSVVMLPIFTRLKEPTIAEPSKPVKIVKTEDRKEEYDEWDKIKFTEEFS